MSENPQPAPAGEEPLPPNAFDESEAVARELTVPELFVLITALSFLVALGRAVEPILSPLCPHWRATLHPLSPEA